MAGKFINLLAMGVGVVWTALMAVACLVACLTGGETRGRAVQRAWARGILRIMGIQVEILDLENLPRKAAVLAPNHESNFDVILIAALPLDFRWVSKIEVARVPVVGWALKGMGAYLVRRDRSGHDVNVMRQVEEGLRKGHSILIFPEGTRTRTGELLPFKKGAFKTAQNAGVPLCPIGIRGAREIAPPGELPSRRGHHVTLRFGRPFPVPAEAKLEDVMAEFREMLVKLLEPAGGKAVRL